MNGVAHSFFPNNILTMNSVGLSFCMLDRVSVVTKMKLLNESNIKVVFSAIKAEGLTSFTQDDSKSY